MMDHELHLLRYFFPEGTQFSIVDQGAGRRRSDGSMSRAKAVFVASSNVTRLPPSDPGLGLVVINGRPHPDELFRPAGLDYIRRFTLLRRDNEPRYLLPNDSLKSIRSVVTLTATRRPSQLAQFAKISSIRLGAIHFGNEVFIAMRHQPEIEKCLGEALGEAEISIAVSAGTPGAYRTTIFQVSAASTGRTLAFAKRAEVPLARVSLANEARTLTALRRHRHLAPRIPRILRASSTPEHDTILMSAGPSTPGSQHFGPAHLEFLRLLLESRSGLVSFDQAPYRRVILRRLGELSSTLSTSWTQLLANALARLDAGLGTFTLPVITTHGDFAPWNTRKQLDGSLFVFDWEFSRTESLPLFDMFHFTVMPAFRRTQHSGLLWSKFRERWTANAACLGIAHCQVLPLYAAYLLDLLLFYLQARHLAPSLGDDRIVLAARHELTELLPLL